MNNSHCAEDQAVAICPICGYASSQVLFHATSWEPFARDQVYEIRRCHNCHVAFTSPMACSESLDMFYSQGLYRDTRNRLHALVEGVSWIFQWSRLRKITRVRQQGKLLDVGCGKGRFLAYAAGHSWDVYGVEPSENGYKIASERLPNRVVRNLGEIDSSKRFDVVTLWHVLEHVAVPIEILREIRPYVKPGGYLLVAVPNFASLQAQFGKRHWAHLDVPRHQCHYTPDTLKNTLEVAGYTVLQIDHFVIEFNLVGMLQTTLNLLGCEPGLIYSLIKRNIFWSNTANKIRFLYSITMAVFGIPLLFLPTLLLAYLESLIGRGGSILAYATPAKLEE